MDSEVNEQPQTMGNGAGVDDMGIKGEVRIELFGPDGELKDCQVVENLVTDTGDLYYAQKAIAAIAPASPSAPTAMAHMKLGTGTTAAAKAQTALVTYKSGSSQAFDATYPQTNMPICASRVTFRCTESDAFSACGLYTAVWNV